MNKILKWSLIAFVIIGCVGIILYSVGNYALNNNVDKKCSLFCESENVVYAGTNGNGYCDCIDKNNNNQKVTVVY